MANIRTPMVIFFILFLLTIRNTLSNPNITTKNTTMLRRASITITADNEVFEDEMVASTIQKKKKNVVTNVKRFSSDTLKGL